MGADGQPCTQEESLGKRRVKAAAHNKGTQYNSAEHFTGTKSATFMSGVCNIFFLNAKTLFSNQFFLCFNTNKLAAGSHLSSCLAVPEPSPAVLQACARANLPCPCSTQVLSVCTTELPTSQSRSSQHTSPYLTQEVEKNYTMSSFTAGSPTRSTTSHLNFNFLTHQMKSLARRSQRLKALSGSTGSIG